MKIILSRKGFDSKYGGQPSPIFEDGTMLSLPIPQENETIGYDELEFPFENEHWKNKKSYFNIISDLKAKTKISEKHTAHLDPDLIQNVNAESKKANWKAIFGQSSAAQSHLENHNIDKGDIFLFFGSFRETEFDNSTPEPKLKYKADAPTIHAIWGYLVVDKKIEPSKTKGEIPAYAKGHPHAKEERKNEEGNCMYVAAEKVTINGEKFKGYGIFVFKEHLHQLTLDGKSKSK